MFLAIPKALLSVHLWQQKQKLLAPKFQWLAGRRGLVMLWLNALWDQEFISNIRESVLKGSLDGLFPAKLRGKSTLSSFGYFFHHGKSHTDTEVP